MPAPQFQDDDEAGQHWIGILQSGDPREAITARSELARIFERRGMLAEVVDLLERNAQAGVKDPMLYTRLAGHYRSLGRTEDADAAMSHAAALVSRMQQAPPFPSYQHPQPSYQPQPVQYSQQPAQQQNVVVHNVVNVGAMGGGHPPLVIRLLYFLVIGWWFGFIWIGIALASFPFIVTIPLGIWMLNRTGRAFFL